MILSLVLVALLAGFTSSADPVGAGVTITRTAPSHWRLDYTFDEPVRGIVFGPPAVEYRRRAWRVLTPGAALDTLAGREAVLFDDPTAALSVEVGLYTDYAPDQYAPFVSFSDGGAAVYLGFFVGAALVDGAERPLDLTMELAGLDGEHVVEPDAAGAYAYFGPQTPAEVGRARLVLDPDTPAWLHETLDEVVRRTTPFFADRLGADLPAPPLVLIGAGEVDAFDGFSVKGGALGGQVTFLLRGRDLRGASDAGRAMLERLVAHELAHLWQARTLGGFNDGEPWVHEGAAEAMAVYALGETGLWAPADLDAFVDRAAGRCAAAVGDGTLVEAVRGGAWDAVYACGFGLFWNAEADPLATWAALAEAAGPTGVPSQAALDEVLAAGRARRP